MGSFWKGKNCIIAKFQRTDLVRCSHSIVGKTQSYSQINKEIIMNLILLSQYLNKKCLPRVGPDKSFIPLLGTSIIFCWVGEEVFLLAKKFNSFEENQCSLACSYSKMSLLRPPNAKTTWLLRPVFSSSKWYFPYNIVFDIKTTSLIRPLLGSPKGGLNIGTLLQ